MTLNTNEQEAPPNIPANLWTGLFLLFFVSTARSTTHWASNGNERLFFASLHRGNGNRQAELAVIFHRLDERNVTRPAAGNPFPLNQNLASFHRLPTYIDPLPTGLRIHFSFVTAVWEREMKRRCEPQLQWWEQFAGGM